VNTINGEQKTTDAEEIIYFLDRVLHQAESLHISADNKLACVITECPSEENGGNPSPLMSPMFYDMFKKLESIEEYLYAVQKSVDDAQLPVRYGQAIACGGVLK